MDQSVHAPVEAQPDKKKRRRVRKRTRDKRKRKMEEWDAAHGLTGTTGGPTEAGSDDGESSAEGEEGQVAETTVAEEVSRVGSKEDANASGSVASAASLPATLGKASSMELGEHEDIIRRVREEQRVIIDQFEDENYKLRTEVEAIKKELDAKIAEVKSLNGHIDDLNKDVEDPERGYAVQLQSNDETITSLKAEATRMKERIAEAVSNRDRIDKNNQTLSARNKKVETELRQHEQELTRLQALIAEGEAAKNDLDDTTAALEECREELAQYHDFDEKLTQQLDDLLQGMVNPDNTLDKVDILGKNLQEAREQAERSESARNAAQQEVEKHVSAHQTMDLSEVSSVSYDPVHAPKSASVTASTQTMGAPLSTSGITTLYDVPYTPAPISTMNAFTQTPTSKLREAGTQTSVVIQANANTQTVSPAVQAIGTQTPSARMQDSDTQTFPAATKTHSSQTTTAVPKMTGTQTDLIMRSERLKLQRLHTSWLYILSILVPVLLIAWTLLGPSDYYVDDYTNRHSMYKKDLNVFGGIDDWLGVDTRPLG